MKRDMELVRQILLDVENGTDYFQTIEMDTDGSVIKDEKKVDDIKKMAHHLHIMIEAGLLESEMSSYSGLYIKGLTWEGHDFLDTVRDPNIWKKTKAAATTVGGVGFKAMVEIGKAIAKQELQKLGIPIP